MNPGFSFVHVGPLAELDLADVKRRRIAKFSAEPDNECTSATGKLDLAVARELIPQLERDPLESLRGLAADLKEKLSAIETSQKEPEP